MYNIACNMGPGEWIVKAYSLNLYNKIPCFPVPSASFYVTNFNFCDCCIYYIVKYVIWTNVRQILKFPLSLALGIGYWRQKIIGVLVNFPIRRAFRV